MPRKWTPTFRVLLAVHGQRGRHLDVGAVEVGQLGLPVLVLELQEQRAEDGRLVERSVGKRLHVGRRDSRAGLRRLAILSTEAARAEAATQRGHHQCQRGGQLALVQLAVLGLLDLDLVCLDLVCLDLVRLTLVCLTLIGFLQKRLGGGREFLERHLGVLIGIRPAENRAREQVAWAEDPKPTARERHRRARPGGGRSAWSTIGRRGRNPGPAGWRGCTRTGWRCTFRTAAGTTTTKTGPRHDAAEAVGELGLVERAFLVLIAIGKKLLHARRQLVFGQPGVFVGVEGIQERPAEKGPRPSAPAATRPGAAWPETASRRALFLDELASGQPLVLVQPLVAVLIELLDELALLLHHRPAKPAWAARAARPGFGLALGARLPLLRGRLILSDKHRRQRYECDHG